MRQQTLTLLLICLSAASLGACAATAPRKAMLTYQSKPDGAQTTYFTILPLGADRVATLERPADAPGLQQDLEHAKQVVAQRKRDLERRREEQQSDINRASARCHQEQAQGTQGLADDCK